MKPNINELTIGEAKELASMLRCTSGISTQKSHSFEVDKKYFIRSVTHHYLGKVVEINDLCIVMQSCVWVADDGRFHKLMRGEWDSSSEREPFVPEQKVMIFLGGILDATEWTSEIPTTVK